MFLVIYVFSFPTREGRALDGEGLDLGGSLFGVGDGEGDGLGCVLVIGVEVAEELGGEGAGEIDGHADELLMGHALGADLDEAVFFMKDGERGGAI